MIKRLKANKDTLLCFKKMVEIESGNFLSLGKV